ncbi:MAG: LicD family protein [Treponema sp.]|jgi:lipopolysaccharide cholinephosphotransferase|nr:LicD family protein [Treponema sp.]
MNQDNIYKLRSVLQEILDEFAAFCGRNNLTYFITAGTLLGAARHRGFIPWDDDIDIAMPREDYEKFLFLFNKEKSDNYYLLSRLNPDKTGERFISFAKMCKKGTLYAEGHMRSERYSGIFIDIWPFDTCVLFFLPLQAGLIKLFISLYRFKIKAHVPRGRIKYFLSKIICLILPLDFMEWSQKRLCLLFSNHKKEYLSFFSGKYGYKKETHKYNTVFPLIKITFESKEYWAPGNWDKFLGNLYGNYMEIPPVEKRKSHNPKFLEFGQ